MKNKYTVRNTFLYENVALYTFIILFASIETFVILYTIAIVYGTFFLKLQIISILYALIKYNKIGSTFRKIYAQQIKQNKISTNSFLVMEKKGNVFVALKILQLCSTETQKKNKKEKKIYLQKQ